MTTREAPRPPARGDSSRPRGPEPRAATGSSGLATAFAFAAAAVAGGLVLSSSCGSEPPPGASSEQPARVSSLPAPSAAARSAAPATATAEPKASASAAPAAGAAPSAAPEKPYTGPLLGALGLQTTVYPTPDYQPHKLLGYVRLGGKVPVDPGPPLKNAACAKGWYHLVDGGYVCARYATVDLTNPQIRLGITPPNLDDLLPYKYAYNTAHGTPLYRSVPSKEDMIKYEPYLDLAKRARRKADAAAAAADDAPPAPAPAADDAGDKANAEAAAASVGLLGAVPQDEPPKPWWQQPTEPGKPLQIKLADLDSDSDSTMAKRMVKGFFVAVDRTFAWNNRSWYKTTGGLVAPADRMSIVKAPATQGMDFPEGVAQLGFVTAGKAARYDFDAERKKVSVTGQVARFTPVGLTGATASNHGTVFRQTTEGWWMKAIDGTFTEPGPPPADLAPGEKWIDVNLTRKTLVALEGDKPIYGALVSPGKKSKIKEKDHSTVQGTFRIREKHIAVTMDGDGATVSDMPYSIEDVPYVQYFEGSYALHGAFWHNNFGHEMSHGCVNLSPLDAKRVFFWSEPKLPRGWHAVWATPDDRGTIVVVHE